MSRLVAQNNDLYVQFKLLENSNTSLSIALTKLTEANDCNSSPSKRAKNADQRRNNNATGFVSHRRSHSNASLREVALSAASKPRVTMDFPTHSTSSMDTEVSNGESVNANDRIAVITDVDDDSLGAVNVNGAVRVVNTSLSSSSTSQPTFAEIAGINPVNAKLFQKRTRFNSSVQMQTTNCLPTPAVSATIISAIASPIGKKSVSKSGKGPSTTPKQRPTPIQLSRMCESAYADISRRLNLEHPNIVYRWHQLRVGALPRIFTNDFVTKEIIIKWLGDNQCEFNTYAERGMKRMDLTSTTSN